MELNYILSFFISSVGLLLKNQLGMKKIGKRYYLKEIYIFFLVTLCINHVGRAVEKVKVERYKQIGLAER